MTPSRVIEPVSTQVRFSCKYWSSYPDLNITIEPPYLYHDLIVQQYPRGAAATFSVVVGCFRQKIKCIVKHEGFIGTVDATFGPGLRKQI